MSGSFGNDQVNVLLSNAITQLIWEISNNSLHENSMKLLEMKMVFDDG